MDRPRCRWCGHLPTAGPMRRRRVTSCDGSPSVTRTPCLRALAFYALLVDALANRRPVPPQTSTDAAAAQSITSFSGKSWVFENLLRPQLHSLNCLINRSHELAPVDSRRQKPTQPEKSGPNPSTASNGRPVSLATRSCYVINLRRN